MIIFYGQDFELNLTNLNITFIEENALFFDAFFKNYTLPFTLDIDDEISQKLGLIDLENSSDYKVKHFGKIFIDNHFEDAYFLIEVIEDAIECTLYFGKVTIPLMDTQLAALPFPLIKNESVNAWANAIKNKTYPEVSHSFPMVFDDEFKKESNYEAFEGIINNYNGSNFIINSIDGTGAVLNKNIIVPFPYLMGVLKVGFASAGLQMIGDFVNTKANNHILIDPKKNHLEKFSSGTYDNYQFSQTTDEYLDGAVLVYEYEKTYTIDSIGTFSIKAFLNFPKEVIVRQLIIKRVDDVIYSAVGNAIDETITINKEFLAAEIITITLVLEAVNLNVALYNDFVFEKGEGKLNIFTNSFSLAEFMPEITFGTLLNKLRNNQNLKIVISDAYVRMDYVENKFTEVEFKDESDFEMPKPKREPNQSKLYKLKYTDTDFLLIDKNGLINNTTGYRDEDIITIDMDLQILPVENRGTIFSAVRQNNDVFSLLLYNGNDLNGYPVAVDKVYGLTYKLPETYQLRWKNWLSFRLNSETYTDKFTANALEEFLINEGRKKYNKKHIYKKISRTRLSEEEWDFNIESETF